MMYPKILKVFPRENFLLEVFFEGNVKKLYDLKPKFNNPIFKPLSNYSLFKNVKVDTGGYGVIWNDELDLSEYELWSKGKTFKL